MKTIRLIGFISSLLFVIFAFLFPIGLLAQVPQYVKEGGTSTNSFPTNNNRIKMHLLYQPKDFTVLPPTGSISKIYLRSSAAGVTASTYTNFSVSFLQNDTASFPFSGSQVPFLTGFTNALTAATITINSSGVAGDWVGISLPQPFAYNPAKTLIVEISYTGKTAGGFDTYYTSGGDRKRMYSTASNPTTGSTSPGICDFGLDIATSPCPTVVVGGSSTASPLSACSGASFSLGLEGNSTGSAQTYQWQISTDNAAWADIPGAGTLNYITSQTSSHYYRNAVSCGGSTDYSSSILVTTNPLVSGVFTINNTLPTGSGNFASFADAVSFISCGIGGPVVFNVANTGASYDEQVLLPAINGTSASNTITFNGNGATLRFDATSISNRAAFILNGSSHIIIDSLDIDVTHGTQGYGVALVNNADSNIVRKCTVSSSINTETNSYAGIIISATSYSVTNGGGNGNLIERNTINGGFYGIAVSGNSVAHAQHNIIRNNIIKDVFIYSLFLQNNDDMLVSGNDISRPNRLAFPGPPNYNGTSAIYISNVSGLLLEKNSVHNMFDMGTATTTTLFAIDLLATSGTSAGSPNRIENNIVYNINSDGSQYGIFTTQFPLPANNNWNIYHNSFAFDGNLNTGSTSNITCGIELFGSNVNVKNNIISITRNDLGDKYCVHYGAGAMGVSSSNNNVLYMNAAGSSNSIGYYNGLAYATLANWQGSGYNFDKQSLAIDPMFTLASTGDLTPTQSGINDICPSLGVATDILNVARSATPDPGAFEFSLSACSNPAYAGEAVSSNLTACTGATFTLNLEGNNVGAGQTYQWQSSPDNTNWTTISPVLTTPFFNTSQTSSMYYKAAVTCSGGSTVYTSNTLFVTTPGLVSGNFTINNSLPTGSGNFNSFTEAIEYLSCGINGPVVFTVSPFSFPYHEQIVLNPVTGSSSVNTISFLGNGAMLEYTTANSGNRAAIILQGADHIIIDSMVIDVTPGSFGWGIALTNAADSNIIRNCSIIAGTNSTGSNFAGIMLCGSFNSLVPGLAGNANQILNNTVSGGTYGIAVYGSPSSMSMNNVIAGNTLLDSYNYGIFVGNTSNNIISANDISRPNRTVFTAFYGVGAGTPIALNNNLLIEKNRIHNVFDAALPTVYNFYAIAASSQGTSSATPNRVENNLVYHINSDASVYGITGKNANNWNYYHNTIVLDGTAPSTIATADGINVSGTAVNVKNNIVYISSLVAGRKSCLNYAVNGISSSDYNVLYNNSTVGMHNNIGYQDTDYATLADWKMAAGAIYDQHSISIDPIFIDPLMGNYTPTEGSIDNLGIPRGVTTDILNQPRSAVSPDPGAYEFASVLPVVILNFKGHKAQGGNKLEWTTATEIDNAGFEIMRSANGRQFETIGSHASNAPNGNSNSQLYYQFTDNKTPGNTGWYYQLKQVDKNGRVRYSKIIFIAGSNAGPWVVSSMYPNPVANSLYLTVQSPANATVALQITDIAGRQVSRVMTTLAAGQNSLQIDVQQLAKGTYLLKATDAEGQQQIVRKFIKQ